MMQVNATGDAGGMHLRFRDGSDATAFLLAPMVRMDRDGFTAIAGGSIARFDEIWSAQAAFTTSYYMRMHGPLQAEAEASVDATMQPDVRGTSRSRAGVRVHLPGDARGVWLGAHAGRASDGLVWRSMLAGDIGAWIRRNGTTGLLHLSPTALENAFRYTDAIAAGRVESGRLEVAVSVGFRAWNRPAHLATTGWGSVYGAFWFGDHVAITASGGNYPADPAQGSGAGRYVTAGVRMALRRPTTREAVSNVIRRVLPPAARPVVERFRAHQVGTGDWVLDVAAPGADRVELMGDFTDWRVVALRRKADGRWSVTLAIAPGTHRMNLRVDGGTWGIPPGMPMVIDEFSGVVALLTVE